MRRRRAGGRWSRLPGLSRGTGTGSRWASRDAPARPQARRRKRRAAGSRLPDEPRAWLAAVLRCRSLASPRTLRSTVRPVVLTRMRTGVQSGQAACQTGRRAQAVYPATGRAGCVTPHLLWGVFAVVRVRLPAGFTAGLVAGLIAGLVAGVVPGLR